MESKVYDCIVVGAGPAGLSASLFLARYLHTTLTFHHNSPRNEYAHGVHGFLGHHDIAPADLLARGRKEVTLHGGSIVEAFVTEVERISNDHFRVSLDRQGQTETFDARRLLLATGLRDLTPAVPGFREFYGESVHHCPDCDGYEARSKRIAVLGRGIKTVGFALGLLTWTDKVTLITNGDAGDMTEADRAQLSGLGIKVLDQNIVALDGDIEAKRLRRVLFKNGEALECDALFFNLGTELASDLHETLGCKLDEECDLVWVDETQQTSVPGVYAAGDITPNSQLAVVAAAEGARAAIHIHQSLIPDERKVQGRV
jgi:thioredoxin reductase